MAELPDMVAQTFGSVGSLQMYRLRERARLRCVQCQQQRVASLVATIWRGLEENALRRLLRPFCSPAGGKG
jgi:hypothetical protein